MPMEATPPTQLRLAEVIAALSLAADLGLGQPMAHGLRTCLLALGLGRALDLSEHQLADTYYTTLLRFVGCTADSHDLMAFAAGEDVRFRQLMVSVSGDLPEEMAPPLVQFVRNASQDADVARRVTDALESPQGLGARIAAVHCEVAAMLAARIGLGRPVCDALLRAFERWDGRGAPHGRAGHDVPIAVRVAILARDIEVLTRTHGVALTRDALRRRRGHAYDPEVVDAFLRSDAAILAECETHDAWRDVLRREPGEPTWVPSDRIDDVLTAFADFADVKTPFTLGHSRGVADLADGAARTLGLSSVDATCVRRAGLLHDLGRSGVPNAIWERAGALSLDQWERVRLHPYYTERILNHCEFLRPLGTTAGAHHERLDGSGYYRGSRGAGLDVRARVLAAADVCHAMLQPRPYRPARTLDDAVRELRAETSAGRLDARTVEAVIAAAGAPPQPGVASQKFVVAARAARRLAGKARGGSISGICDRRATPPDGMDRRPNANELLGRDTRATARPAGLTGREVEVLRLMAQGHSNRQMAEELGITPKTAGHHVQHIYDKIGVSTRAAAAVFAVEQGLLTPAAAR